MVSRTPFAFTERLRGSLLDEVLILADGVCSTLGLVWRLESYVGLSTEMTSILESAFVDEVAATTWPGAEVRGRGAVQVRHYRYDSMSQQVLSSVGDLGKWRNPELPDDPHLLRADGSAWLGSSTVDEGSAWLELSEAEFVDLAGTPPWVADLLGARDFYLPNDPRLIGPN
jgi:hypothetical protein